MAKPLFLPQLRKSRLLRVIIEEDHNEVVPHIHRAIASRYLPMASIAMVHFDSHPDLLLPLHMQADTVFIKEQLYSELSIENWILPLVYAGHVDEIFWMKPPWADQMADISNLKFSVGKHKNTGEIRVTLKDPYFLTDALYAPETNMTNVKHAVLHVITVLPPGWNNGKNYSESFSAKHSNEQMPSSLYDARKRCYTEGTEDGNGSDCEPKLAVTEKDCPQKKVTKLDIVDTDNDSGMCKTTFDRNICDSMVSCNDATFIAVQKADTFVETKLMIYHKWKDLAKKLEGKSVILDIDLDFFSTKDPFRSEYSPEVILLLKELFEFHLLTDLEEESTQVFVQQRQAQLDELRSVFQQLQKNPDAIPKLHDHEKLGALNKLLRILETENSQHQKPVDFELLFRAGCTFDGTDLPHHVSTSQEIQKLMEASGELLKCLPQPALVTVSRSSIDDYCPQHQVDSIQQATIKMLENIFRETDVQKYYEQE